MSDITDKPTNLVSFPQPNANHKESTLKWLDEIRQRIENDETVGAAFVEVRRDGIVTSGWEWSDPTVAQSFNLISGIELLLFRLKFLMIQEAMSPQPQADA